jgi:hypothetical protein
MAYGLYQKNVLYGAKNSRKKQLILKEIEKFQIVSYKKERRGEF